MFISMIPGVRKSGKVIKRGRMNTAGVSSQPKAIKVKRHCLVAT